MRQFGLIGYPLSHSFSKGYFTEKFSKEGIDGTAYENYPIEQIAAFNQLWKDHVALEGLNVTIPHKKSVIPYLQYVSPVVKDIQACNCIRKFEGALYGYNTDVVGFEKSLHPFLKSHHKKALILGTGGAAAAVEWVLKKLNIQYQFVSRSAKGNADVISYTSLIPDVIEEHTLIINTSPVGMYPNVDEAPPIPYEAINAQHHLYDLIYNPAITKFLANGLAQGATTQNGLEMLHLQAEESWRIWNTAKPI